MENNEKEEIKRELKGIKKELKGEPEVFVYVRSKYREDRPMLLFVRGKNTKEAREHIKDNIWFDLKKYNSFGKLEDLRWSVVNGRKPVFAPEDEV